MIQLLVPDAVRRHVWPWVLLGIVAILAVGQTSAPLAEDVKPQPAAKSRPAEVGLKQRVPWTTSRLIGSPEPPRPYIVEPVFPAQAFQQPVELVAIPGTNRLAMVELRGQIFSFADKPDPQGQRDLFADLKQLHPDFWRVYGLTFHPQFPQNRSCFIAYVLTSGKPDGTRVSRFKVTDTNPPRLDLASEEVLVSWLSGGHNGGHLQFGPDGCLYISSGDGSDPFPPDRHNTGQDVNDLLSSVLRIDVDHADAPRKYRIPNDNPFVSLAGARGEVWAYGLRNPWKMCFDPADGSLWVADVGWELWEMIYRVERGGNYGWSLFEGRQPVHKERTRGPSPIIPPTVEHDHTESRSITGGYFSQSPRLPELKGAYIYGDYVTGKIWALKHKDGKVTWREELVDTPLQIATFGLDHQGEVLIVDYVSGQLYRLAPNPRKGANAAFPRRLSETGLFAKTAEHLPAPGVIPYSINAEPWADGTTAERFVALPGTSKLGVYTKTDVQIGYIAGESKFPDGGVLAKTISLELEPGRPSSRRRLETQVLHFDVDTWQAYNYLWNDEQTDAVLADAGLDRVYTIVDKTASNGKRQQTWHHASRNECILCHTTRAGSIHGFRVPQLQRDHDYQGTVADQLQTLAHIGLFEQPLPEKRGSWVNPYDPAGDLTARARAYLHVNCAHCHRRGGGGSAPFDSQITTDLAKANLLNTRPTQGTFNIHGAQIVVPGDPYRSVLFYRMSKLGHGRMPQFGSRVVDPQGTQLIHDWIASLPGKSPPTESAPAAIRPLVSPGADAAAVKSALEQTLSSTSGALQVLHRLSTGQLTPAAGELVRQMGPAHADPLVRDLFEQFVPEEQRTKRLGSIVSAAEILSLPADAARGKRLFFEAAGVDCRNCHRIGDAGKVLGPDLTQIGKKFDRARLLENILEPSKTIDPPYVTYVLETTAGKVLTGLLVRRDAREVVLRHADGKETRTPAAEVEVLTPQQKSLMPDLLLQNMTASQVADLLEYLSSLK